MGCNNDYQRSSPNGYRLVRTNQFTIMIWTGKQGIEEYVVVGPRVKAIAVWKETVMGEVVLDPNADQIGKPVAGHFVLDTRSGSLRSGLSKDELASEMKARGLDKIPALVDPAQL